MVRKIKRTVRLAAAMLTALSLTLAHIPPLAISADSDEYIGVIVKLDIDADTCEVTQSIKAELPDIEIKNEYGTLFNGFSADIKRDSLAILQSVQGVSGVFADTEYSALSFDESEYEIIYDPAIMPDDDPTRGAGAVIAVLDDGFYLRHEVFTLSDNSSVKLISDSIKNMLHFTKAYRLYPYTSVKNVYKNEKIPFAFDYADRDTNVYSSLNHGTAMMSVAAGNSPDGTLESAAPAAQVLAMKVYSDKNNTAKASDIVSALEDAYILGADSVCLSLGSPCGFSDSGLYNSLLEETIAEISTLGVTVVCAAGNDSSLGAGSIYNKYYGYYETPTSMPDSGTVNAPSTVPEAVSVASADTFIARARAFSLYGTNIHIPYSDSNSQAESVGKKSFAEAFAGQILEYVPIGGVGKAEDFVQNGVQLDLTGKIALICRGEISFVEKVNNAAANGAIAVIVYDNAASETPAIRTAMQLEGASIPAILISASDGEVLKGARDKRICPDPKIKYVTNAGITPSPSEFTSRGPSPTLDIKPELAAAGTDVTVAASNGSYKTMSGTSVSAAYTAGCAARLSAKLDLPEDKDRSKTIKNILMNTAEPMKTLTDDGEKYYSVTLQGAGYISPVSAADAEIVVTSDGVGKVLLGNDIEEEFEIRLTLENLTGQKRSFELSAVIGSESFETLEYSELCSEKDLFTKENAELMYEYLGKAENAEISFTGETIDELEFASVKCGDAEINKSADSFTWGKITLSPHETREIIISVKLDKRELELLGGVFENGMYIEGYIFVQGERAYSVPFLGFYGDFYAVDPFESSLYENGGIFGGTYLYTYYADDFSDRTVMLGTNPENLGERTYMTLTPELAVISPVAEGSEGAVFIKISLLRNLKRLKAEIFNSDGELVALAGELYGLKKAYLGENSASPNAYAIKLWDCRDANNYKYIYEDGEYICKLTGVDASERTFEKELRFIVDSEKPRPASYSVREEGKNIYLDVTVSDNSYVSSVYAYTFNEKEIDAVSENVPEDGELAELGADGEFTVSFDISGSVGQYVYIEMNDIAFNSALARIDLNKQS